jgi:hypothetical protein
MEKRLKVNHGRGSKGEIAIKKFFSSFQRSHRVKSSAINLFEEIRDEKRKIFSSFLIHRTFSSSSFINHKKLKIASLFARLRFNRRFENEILLNIVI